MQDSKKVKKSSSKKSEKESLKELEKSIDEAFAPRKVKKSERDIKNVSIDKIRIVGSIKQHLREHFAHFVSNEIGIKLFKEGSEARGEAVGVAQFEFSDHKAKAMGIPPFWIEFNPNHLDEEKERFLKEKMLKFISNAHLTRLDLAFDVNFDLSQMTILQKHATKSTIHYSPSKEIETMYFGARGGEKFLRIYNKKKQLDEVLEEEVEDEILWRLEWELRRNEADILTTNKTPFDAINILQKGNTDSLNVQEKAMLFYLEHNPQGWSEMTKNTKKKYKEMLLEIADEDISESFIKAYKQKKSDLLYEVTSWLKATQQL